MDPIQKRKEYYSAHPEMIGMNLMGKGASFARGIPGDEGARRAGVPTFNEYMAAQDAEAAGQVVPLAPASPPTNGAPVPMPRPVTQGYQSVKDWAARIPPGTNVDPGMQAPPNWKPRPLPPGTEERWSPPPPPPGGWNPRPLPSSPEDAEWMTNFPSPSPMPRPTPQTGGGLKKEPPNFETGGELVQGKAPRRRSNDLFRQYMAMLAAQGG